MKLRTIFLIITAIMLVMREHNANCDVIMNKYKQYQNNDEIFYIKNKEHVKAYHSIHDKHSKVVGVKMKSVKLESDQKPLIQRTITDAGSNYNEKNWTAIIFPVASIVILLILGFLGIIGALIWLGISIIKYNRRSSKALKRVYTKKIQNKQSIIKQYKDSVQARNRELQINTNEIQKQKRQTVQINNEWNKKKGKRTRIETYESTKSTQPNSNYGINYDQFLKYNDTYKKTKEEPKAYEKNPLMIRDANSYDVDFSQFDAIKQSYRRKKEKYKKRRDAKEKERARLVSLNQETPEDKTYGINYDIFKSYVTERSQDTLSTITPSTPPSEYNTPNTTTFNNTNQPTESTHIRANATSPKYNVDYQSLRQSVLTPPSPQSDQPLLHNIYDNDYIFDTK